MQLLSSFEVCAVNQSNFVLWICFFAPFGWVHHHHGCTDKNPVWKYIPFVEDLLSWEWVWNPSSPIQCDHHHQPWVWWRVTIKQFFLQNVWTVMTGLHVYAVGSSGPCSRALASLGSRDSEPTAATGQFSGKQQQQVFVSFIIENVGEMNRNKSFFFCCTCLSFVQNQLHHGSCLFMKWSFKVVVSPISLWAGSLIDMYTTCGGCSTRYPYTMQLLGWPCYFDSMGSACINTPTSKHYVYGWSWLMPAIYTTNMIKTMSCEPTVAMWRTLPSACRIHGDVEMGIQSTNQFLKVDPGNDTGSFTFIQHLCCCWLGGIPCKKLAPEKGKMWRNRQFVADGPTGKLQQMIRVQSAEIPA